MSLAASPPMARHPDFAITPKAILRLHTLLPVPAAEALATAPRDRAAPIRALTEYRTQVARDGLSHPGNPHTACLPMACATFPTFRCLPLMAFGGTTK